MARDIEVGTAVVVCGITDPHDVDLNGRRGILVPKHRYSNSIFEHTFGEVGVKLDPLPGQETPERINVLRKEIREVC